MTVRFDIDHDRADALRVLAGNLAGQALCHGMGPLEEELTLSLIDEAMEQLTAARAALDASALAGLPASQPGMPFPRSIVAVSGEEAGALVNAIEWNRTYEMGGIIDYRADLEADLPTGDTIAEAARWLQAASTRLQALDDIAVNLLASRRREIEEEREAAAA